MTSKVMHSVPIYILKEELTFGAGDPWVANVPGRTRAHGLVVSHATERVNGARVRHGARIEALAVDTGRVGRALGVVAAFRR